MNKIITIKGKKVGYNQKCYIIAEAGVNHNGRLDLALKMVDVAKEAGVDAVKFQTFKSEGVMTKNVPMAEYQKKNTGKFQSMLDMARRLELKYDDFIKIKKYCDKKGITFLSTPHSYDAIDFLNGLVSAFKFGSGDLTNLPALQHAAKFKKPIILGTGMANMAEVKEAIKCVKKAGNNKIIALHCTTNYPCPFEEVNLRVIQTMMEELDVLIGYSDHTLGIEVPIMAVGLGVCMIEKHFTLDRNMAGPDHKASLEPDELRKMVEAIRNAEKALGGAVKKPTKNEEKMKKVVRKSIVALEDIKKNDTFFRQNTGIKRPGTGLQPKHYFSILGKKAKRNIKKDALVKKGDYI